MKIGIVGMGHVGKTTKNLLSKLTSEFVTFDLASDRSYPSAELEECEFCVICIGTENRDSDNAHFENILSAVARIPVAHIVIRSTVRPGTIEKIMHLTGKRIVHWPEFVGETDFPGATWHADESDVPFAIIGGTAADREWVLDKLSVALGPHVTLFQCSARESELIKYIENAFLATKLAFVSELYSMVHAIGGVDWHTVREGWLLDPRVGRSHSAVLAGNIGYGGRCLPKDVRAINRLADDLGLDLALLRAVMGYARD